MQTFQPFGQFIDFDPGQAAGAIDTHVTCVIVYFLAGQHGATGHLQCHHPACRIFRRATEYLEFDVRHKVVNGHQLQVDPEVGLVGAITLHGFVPGHMGEFPQINIKVLREQGSHQPLG